MAQATNANADNRTDDHDREAIPSLTADFLGWTTAAQQLVQDEVRRRIERNHAAGRPVYFGGAGPDIGKVFERRPDGSVVEVRVMEDGAIEEIGHGAE